MQITHYDHGEIREQAACLPCPCLPAKTSYDRISPGQFSWPGFFVLRPQVQKSVEPIRYPFLRHRFMKISTHLAKSPSLDKAGAFHMEATLTKSVNLGDFQRQPHPILRGLRALDLQPVPQQTLFFH